MDYVKLNQQVWDKNVDNKDIWTQPVSTEEIMRAKNGEWKLVVTPTKPVPKEWFPKIMTSIDVLCLASGGGQQGPIMAVLGANVTVFDNSQNQLNQDLLVAERDGLRIKTVQGDMKNLSKFENESFDLIIHPWSNSFIDNVQPVWEETYRVLRHGGILISGFANPISYIFDLKNMNEGKLVVRHKVPYSDLTSLPEEELKELIIDQGEAVCFGHTLDDQIGGQIKAGFIIGGFYEDIGGIVLDKYINSSIATQAIKI
ncbi:class I SAM-dependent methyltransferase [Vallitalea okinawensis]|uniref:class I SAM-dependent methyltransferase n=1 Tax=Vallitalea okinawensis TaxID=2078660 RepID=UPI000CFD31DE|nr:class I SAM-dependent methyltransferase [Vallitalea okinawensis]